MSDLCAAHTTQLAVVESYSFYSLHTWGTRFKISSGGISISTFSLQTMFCHEKKHMQEVTQEMMRCKHVALSVRTPTALNQTTPTCCSVLVTSEVCGTIYSFFTHKFCPFYYFVKMNTVDEEGIRRHTLRNVDEVLL